MFANRSRGWDVALYAFDARKGAQIFTSPAGTGPSGNSDANLVPVFANGVQAAGHLRYERAAHDRGPAQARFHGAQPDGPSGHREPPDRNHRQHPERHDDAANENRQDGRGRLRPGG